MEFMLQILMSAEGFYSAQRCSCLRMKSGGCSAVKICQSIDAARLLITRVRPRFEIWLSSPFHFSNRLSVLFIKNSQFFKTKFWVPRKTPRYKKFHPMPIQVAWVGSEEWRHFADQDRELCCFSSFLWWSLPNWIHGHSGPRQRHPHLNV